MKKLWLEHRGKIIIAVIVIGFFIALYFIVKKKAKSDVIPNVIKIPDGQGGVENFNPGAYTDALYREIDKDNRIYGRDLKPHLDLLGLSDAKFVAVYNDWNQRYFKKENNRSLIQRYQDEYGYGFPYSTWDSDHAQFTELKQRIIDRAKLLNLY